MPPSGKRKPGLLVPPLAQVDDLVQPAVAVIELALVDQEARLDPPFGHGRQDLVERHDDDRHVLAQAELERQVGRRELARHGDRLAAQVVERRRLAGDQRRAVAIAHARARREQGVAVGQVGEGVDADGRDLQLAVQGAAG